MVDLRSLLEMRQAVPLSFSDDGSRLLVASNVPGTDQLYALPSRGGELEQLTDLAEPVSGFFLPDGRVLVEIDAGGNERTQLHVLHDGELEALVVDPRFIHRTPRVGGHVLAYSTNRRNGVDFDIVARDLRSGEERVFEIGGNCSVESVSPDAVRVAVERIGEQSGDGDLYICSTVTGEFEHVTPHDGAAEYFSVQWVDDRLVFATNEGRDTFGIAVDSKVIFESDWDLDCLVDTAGRNLLVIANEDGYSRLTLHDPRTHDLRREVPLPGRGVVEHPVFSPDGSLLAFAFSSPVEPHDVHVYDVEAETLTRLTTSPRAVGTETFVEPTLHRFDSFDGESVPVFLFEPEGEGPFPVVVTVHGGPESQWLPWFAPSFAPLTQYLVARGYAVAAPNVRGSSGYGKRYEHLDDIEKRLDSVADLASLHDWLTARPNIDGARAVVYGRSYGGYMVLAALALQPERWAAGIECVGISSLVTFLENTSPYRRAAREREYGSLERDRAVLIEASPMTHIDAIRAPLFIQHGRNDPRVPVSESEHIHALLANKGIPSELLIFEDEGHTVAKLPNRIETFTRMAAFLDRVLGVEPGTMGAAKAPWPSG
jgi:dipeptidyl aminopeptidase/acylaminoacyl peptidase